MMFEFWILYISDEFICFLIIEFEVHKDGLHPSISFLRDGGKKIVAVQLID